MINHLHAGQGFLRLLLSVVFSKTFFRITIRVSNRLDPDQVRHFVCPDLGLNCLKK